jgi:hypothetical protein
MEEEADKRAKYKADMAVWRKKAAKQKKAERVEREEIEVPMAPPAVSVPRQDQGGLSNDSAQMQQQQHIMEQMQQQQDQFMGNGIGMATGQGLSGGVAGAHGGNDATAMSQMTMEQQHQLLVHQQREAMLAGAGGETTNMGSMGGDSNAASAQQNLNTGLFGAGNNPYSLQAAGFGGFPGMGATAFGLNAASSNPYLANALAANQAYMQGAAGQAGLSALMGKSLHLGHYDVLCNCLQQP